MSEYIEAFPEARYSVCNVPEVGDFFVDTTDDLIKASLCKGEMWESWNHELLEEYTEPGTTVIDVGAHIGTHTIVMSRMVGADGRVYAFEPQKKVFRELVSNLRLNGIDNVVPLRYAVGAEAGIIEMDPIWDKNEAATAVGKGGDQAELRTIDSFDFSNVSLIKIDVEGYEGYVLDGSEKTIRTWRPAIIIEIKGGEPSSTVSSPLPSPKDNENVSMVLGRLETWGYTAKRTNWHDYLALPDDSADPGGPPQ
jgi:FkbM family methyltransferase